VTEPTLGRIIEDRRLQLALTKSAAARAAGLSRSSWHEIESDQRQALQPETFMSIDRALEGNDGQWPPGTLRARTDKRSVLVIDTKVVKETAPKQRAWGGPTAENARLIALQMQLDEIRRIILELTDDVGQVRYDIAFVQNLLEGLGETTEVIRKNTEAIEMRVAVT
jgi:Helix-turn-helix domain